MTYQAYIKAVGKRLHCTKEKRMEIERQLESDLQAALENGETLEQIFARMGSAKEVAAEFNSNLEEDEKGAGISRRNKRVLMLAAAGIILCVAAACVIAVAALRGTEKMETVKEETQQTEEKTPKEPAMEQLQPDDPVFSEEEVQQAAEQVAAYFYEGAYETMYESASANLKAALGGSFDAAVWQSAKEQLSLDWGSFVSYGKAYMTKVEQAGAYYVVVQMNASYEHVGVTYTLTFDEEMKLEGFYVK